MGVSLCVFSGGLDLTKGWVGCVCGGGSRGPEINDDAVPLSSLILDLFLVDL